MKKPRSIKAIGRKRRTLGWTLLTLGLLVAGVWFASRWVWLRYLAPTWPLDLYEGTSRLELYESPVTFGLSGFQRGWSSRVRWQGRWSWTPLSDHEQLTTAFTPVAVKSEIWSVALWPVPLLFCPPAALLLRSGIVARRRALGNKCKSCGYDLAGLAADAPCPECGIKAAQR